MPLPQAPRRGPDDARPIHFAYVPVDRGSAWDAYIAGPTMWFAMHCSWKSKPCVEEMTRGALTCELCAAGKLATVKGYCPLYRASDARPVCVVVDEEGRDRHERFPLHTRVKVAREKSRGSCVCVTRLLVQEPAYQTTLAERRTSADLTPTLLRMWAIPALAEWYRKRTAESDTPLSLPNDPTARTLNGIAKALEHQAEQSEENADRARKNRAFVEQMRGRVGKGAPLTNGNGHKPEEQE